MTVPDQGSRFIGATRREVVDQLAAAYDQAAQGLGPRIVVLQGSMGVGKSRIAQEFYTYLARTRQGAVPYWPEEITGDDPGSVLTRRKVIAPGRFVAPGGASLPWLWWGIGCQMSHVGTPMQSLQAAAPQLEAHAEAIQSEVTRKARNREDALLAVQAMFDLLGVVDPGAALGAAQKGFTLWRRRRDQRAKERQLRVDRIVDPTERAYATAVELSKSLTEVASVVPVVLVVDDAQWADPALVSLLRHTGELENTQLLVIACVWPEALVANRAGTDTFGSWLAMFEQAHNDRLETFSLGPLPSHDLEQLVLDRAPRTDPAVVAAIVELASGSPLTLQLILDLDRVKRDIAADGSIDIDPIDLAALPRDVQALYQELWRQLDDGTRRALAMVSLQGTTFTPDWLEAATASLGQHDVIMAGWRHAQELRTWIRPSEPPFVEFTELARHRVAFDSVPEVLTDEEEAAVYRAIASHLRQLWQGDAWTGFEPPTQRLVLNQLLESIERGQVRDPEATAQAMVQLAEIELASARFSVAADLARAAMRSGTEDTRLRARRAFGNALVALGRGAEAVQFLEESVAEAATDEARAEVAEELEEALEAAAAPPVLEASEVANPPALLPWTGWERRDLPPLPSLTPSEVGDLIAEVVGAEGPCLWQRVTWLLRAASGAKRSGAAIAASLERGLAAALRDELVVASSPPGPGLEGRRTLRLPGQATKPRELGDRDTWHVPPEELELLARQIFFAEGSTRSAVKNRIAAMYGWKRYTAQLDELLESVLPADIGLPDDDTGAGADRLDPIRALAEAHGVAAGYDALIGAGEAAGLSTRRWPSSTTLTPLDRRQYTLVYVAPRPGCLHVGYSTENFDRFLGIPADEVKAALGGNWRDMPEPEVETFAAALSELVAKSRAPGR